MFDSEALFARGADSLLYYDVREEVRHIVPKDAKMIMVMIIKITNDQQQLSHFPTSKFSQMMSVGFSAKIALMVNFLFIFFFTILF